MLTDQAALLGLKIEIEASHVFELHRKAKEVDGLFSEEVQRFQSRLHCNGVGLFFENRDEKTFLIMREGSTINAFMVTPKVILYRPSV